jgi:ectoine hydroxylase-related dioxygenase (phytanoyl-CoA dioxygenase family)
VSSSRQRAVSSLRRLLHRPAAPQQVAPKTTVAAPPMVSAPVLDGDKQLLSDLWLDQPDAHDRIDERVAAGTLTADDAERLHHFTTYGFAKVSVPVDDAFIAAFEADLDAVWRARPADLAVSPTGNDRTSFRDVEEGRVPGYRIPDFHSHSDAARSLYLHPEIMRVVGQIFDAEPVAFQSLYFEYGSQQGLHRDPMFVAAHPPSHLAASWVALEDITPDSGPLLYAPGSHRMPWFEFEPDRIDMGDKALTKQVEWRKFRDQVCEEMGLEAKPFTCQRGDVFLWHAGLLHGGAPVQNPNATRKSFVTHYSTSAHYNSRRATMRMKVGPPESPWRTVSATTYDVIEANGCKGIDNPLRRLDPALLAR